jgi:hypothetical protein
MSPDEVRLYIQTIRNLFTAVEELGFGQCSGRPLRDQSGYYPRRRRDPETAENSGHGQGQGIDLSRETNLCAGRARIWVVP